MHILIPYGSSYNECSNPSQTDEASQAWSVGGIGLEPEEAEGGWQQNHTRFKVPGEWLFILSRECWSYLLAKL